MTLRKVGGIWFWRLWCFGGSFYVKLPRIRQRRPSWSVDYARAHESVGWYNAERWPL